MKVKAYCVLGEKIDGSIVAVVTSGLEATITSSYNPKLKLSDEYVMIRSDNNKRVNQYRHHAKSSKFKTERVKGQENVRHRTESSQRILSKVCKIMSKSHPDIKFFISRINSKRCPIKIDFKGMYDEMQREEFLKNTKHPMNAFPKSNLVCRAKYTLK